jgi:L-aminopeptidase/D-esterase-like protein
MTASTTGVPHVGSLPAGPLDSIADVAGVTVGHCTLADGAVQTGVTVIRPHGGDPYRDKVPAAATVLNGFGKSIGLVQVDELGVLETPLALTNTFSVGAVAQAQIRAAVAANPEIGRALPTVNALVFECNDSAWRWRAVTMRRPWPVPVRTLRRARSVPGAACRRSASRAVSAPLHAWPVAIAWARWCWPISARRNR